MFSWSASRLVTHSQWSRFLRVLDTCGLESRKFPRPASEHELLRQPFEVFSPLFTGADFSFHYHQLTTLGDTIIDDYLAEHLMEYCVHMGLVLSVNTVKQLNAVFHHHFSMSLFAKELHLDALVLPVQGASDGSAAQSRGGREGDFTSTSNFLDFLEASRPPPRKRDVSGTSFQVAPLRSGQSPLGWQFSHFVGAVHQVYGPLATSLLLEHLYALKGTGNVPDKATRLLLRVLEEYSPMNVAESILAAQGLGLRFVGKTRYISDDNTNQEASQRSNTPNGGRQESAATPSSSSAASPSASVEHAVLVSGFSADSNGAVELPSLDSLASMPDALRASSLAAGPGVVDAQKTWWDRTATLVRSHVEPDPTEALEDGWLTPSQRRVYEGGPAFATSVDFGPVMHTYADTYGMVNPTDGKVVAHRRFSKAVRDPLFYDKLSDMRNGVPLQTDGTPLSEYLDRFNKPHQRLFEVTMLAGGDGGRTVGRAIAKHYTTARESACKAYIGGVLNDIRLIQQQSRSEE